MKWSRRFQWEARPNALSLAKAQALAEGRRLLDLTVSNPTRAGIAYPDDLLAALADPRALRYEPEAAGLRAAREAVAEYYANHGATVHPDQILLTASTSEAYHYLFKLVGDPGDEVLVPRPSYPLFEFLAGLELLHAIPYATRNPDPCNLATERTRAVVTVHPNNPTGEYLSPAGAASLVARCAELRLALLADEVFLDYPLDEARPRSFAAAPEGLVCVLSGLSKVCGLPQMKLGWMVLAGENGAVARGHLDLIADTYLSVSAPVQWASLLWLRRRAEVQQAILSRVRQNSDRIRRALSGSGIAYQPPQGGWTAVVQLPGTLDEEVLVLRLLEDYGILVQPGYFYDFTGSSRVVLSLLSTPEELEEGLQGLKRAVDSLRCDRIL